MPGRNDLIEALEKCEQSSALLLLALESGQPDPLDIMAQRNVAIEAIGKALPAEMYPEDFERIQGVFRVGEEARARLNGNRRSLASSLVALNHELLVARGLSPAKPTRRSSVVDVQA